MKAIYEEFVKKKAEKIHNTIHPYIENNPT